VKRRLKVISGRQQNCEVVLPLGFVTIGSQLEQDIVLVDFPAAGHLSIRFDRESLSIESYLSERMKVADTDVAAMEKVRIQNNSSPVLIVIGGLSFVISIERSSNRSSADFPSKKTHRAKNVRTENFAYFSNEKKALVGDRVRRPPRQRHLQPYNEKQREEL
jgi:hypothetical protein